MGHYDGCRDGYCPSCECAYDQFGGCFCSKSNDTSTTTKPHDTTPKKKKYKKKEIIKLFEKFLNSLD